MKKILTTITLAIVMTFGATFVNADAGIIVAGSPGVIPPCTTTTDGIIVAGRAIVGAVFGIIVAGSPGAEPCVGTDGIIVAG